MLKTNNNDSVASFPRHARAVDASPLGLRIRLIGNVLG